MRRFNLISLVGLMVFCFNSGAWASPMPVSDSATSANTDNFVIVADMGAKAEKMKEKAEAKHEKAMEKAEAKHEKAMEKADAKKEKAEAKAEAMQEKAEKVSKKLEKH